MSSEVSASSLLATERAPVPRFRSVADLIGNTPVIPLQLEPEGVTIHAKCEFLNPSGSIKDRLAQTIIDDAEARGVLHRESVILECSSGNTGVAFAMMGAARGYRVTIVISEEASRERLALIRQLGGQVITFPESSYEAGIELTRKLAAENPNYFLPRQFENPLNAQDHEHTTATELIRQVPARIDAFVAGYGTGGTLAGVSRGLRAQYPDVKIFAMEPAEAALLLGETSCRHSIEGIADGFVPPLLNGVSFDGVLKVSSAEALAMTQRLTQTYGLLVGMSSGANVAAALKIAKMLGREKTIATLLCDRAERYFSTQLFQAVGADCRHVA
jgi:cysteine synthase A